MEERFREIFSHWANTYDETVYEIDGEYQDVFKNYPHILKTIMYSLPPRAKKVLDIGCGTGNFISLLRETGLDVTGVEPSQHMREKALIKHDDFHIVDGDFLNLPQGSYDAIVASYAFHHLDYSKKKEAIIYMDQHLQEGGTLILADTMFQSTETKSSLMTKIKAKGYTHLLHDLDSEYYEFLDDIISLFTGLNYQIEHQQMNDFVWLVKATKLNAHQ